MTNEGNAVQRLGVSKDRRLVIENAPLGIQSAKTAGLRCIAVTTYLGREYLKEADIIIDDHKEIWEYILMLVECRDEEKNVFHN